MRQLSQKVMMIVFWGILSSLTGLELEAARVHLIIVGDSLDKDIGTDVSKDINDLESEMQEVGGGYILPPVIINGVNCNRETIISSLNNLQFRNDDTVFFYYSGHGAYDEISGQYMQIPRLGDSGNIPRNDIRDQIKGWVDKKELRLGILMTDMCNLRTVIRIFVPDNAVRSAGQDMGGPGTRKPQLWKALFLDSSGFVDISSASKGEAAANFPKIYDQRGRDLSTRGSIFLSSFVSDIATFKYDRLSWDSFLTKHLSPGVKSEFAFHYSEGIPLPNSGEIQLTQTVQIDSVARLTGGPEFVNQDTSQYSTIPDLDDRPSFPDGVIISSINTIISNRPVIVQARDGFRQGVRILAVVNNPVLASKWKPGDVILSVGGIETQTAEKFLSVIAHSPDLTWAAWWMNNNGINVSLVQVILRGNIPPLDLGNIPPADLNNNQPADLGNTPQVDQPKPKLGVVPAPDVYSVQTPNGEERGIRISQVLANTPAYGILDPGDIILKINDQPTPDDVSFRKAIAEARDTIQIYGWDSRTGDVKDFQPIPLNK